MTLAQLQTIVGYAIAKYGGESELHVEFTTDGLAELNYVRDGRVNDIIINKPELQSSQVVMWLDTMTQLDPIVRLFAQHGIQRRRIDNWRQLNPPIVGAIHALPELRGQCVATDGIECLVVQPTGKTFIGHYDFFIRDPVEKSSTRGREQTRMQRLKDKYQ